jgi:hypothetical protein
MFNVMMVQGIFPFVISYFSIGVITVLLVYSDRHAGGNKIPEIGSVFNQPSC